MGEFLINNVALVALFLASGVMLVWPELSKLVGAGGEQLGTLEATRLMNQGTSLVLDVRDAAEFTAGHLPRSRNIPAADLEGRIEEIRKYKEKPVLVIGSGARAGAASRILKKAGFTTAYTLKGGLAAWQQAGLPVEK
ncbi:rhodanese-like domain-containing protein [Usitatibacter palustris]|uniref:Thiosulfate sulfurtransferase GlpE n=1 Tax=Usitatibacter palustris TaxID=2732487 RepID=A0A6M4H7D7_9PROT|nr:rhodanese-like domain-containing protein [Usitatibacter palustris]QJR13897.1 Thiosulfate sulfurtransferase GlpE [Usitatibacter palustris]